MRYLIERFKERSTWVGLGAMSGAAQYWFTDMEFDAFVTMMAGIMGFISAVWKEQK